MQRIRRQAEVSAVTDNLTGLSNRAGIYLALETALSKARATRESLGVLLLDLDGFKQVNDTLGHAAGDKTLVETARRISAWLRPGWRGGRRGGDEFAVLCPGVSPEDMPFIAEELSEVLSELPSGNLVVSASVGHASATADSIADSLLAHADASMYAKKSERRNTKPYRDQSR